ncbi:type 1 glutamine amidotransferase [Cutibacterium sp. WCA-380-WT-3A]|uniref:Type 1 glutamine amidotransferase n=1 Tax=Cutibacterium porci TaxID=2605781 RepID=A0A7K0J3J7_9ACTN|nr:type 1 glutamine amidotransferase [Cutibacterium porci]MSS44496.1 type 1 glutamine amidotransferase [Cutibacterium porci]
MTRILVIVHEPSCSSGRLGHFWRGAGAEVIEVNAWTQPVPPVAQADALVVLGGSMGCHDDAEAPWLAPTRRLIARTVKTGTPFLGFCLGHQLATVALGGRVCTCDHLCLGPAEMHLTPDGEQDPLLSVYQGHRGIHFNNDVAVVVPEGAVLLASDPSGQVEAVSFAERAWGVQFHPECTPDIFDGWTIGHTEEGWNQRLPWADAVSAAEAVRYDVDVATVGTAFAARFLELVDPEKR